MPNPLKMLLPGTRVVESAVRQEYNAAKNAYNIAKRSGEISDEIRSRYNIAERAYRNQTRKPPELQDTDLRTLRRTGVPIDDDIRQEYNTSKRVYDVARESGEVTDEILNRYNTAERAYRQQRRIPAPMHELPVEPNTDLDILDYLTKLDENFKKKDGGRVNFTMPVILRRRQPQRYAAGGLASAANRVRDAGREDDTMLVHITPTEYEMLKDLAGEPTVHPGTGMPEFGLWKSIKKAFKTVSPFIAPAVSILAPGVTSSIGEFLGAGPQWANALGSGILGGGLGALGGGLRGGLIGAGLGGAAGYYSPDIRGWVGLDPTTGMPAGSALGEYTGSLAGGTGGAAPAGQALGTYTGSMVPTGGAGSPIASATGAGGGGGGLGMMGKALPLLLAVGALSGAGRQNAPGPPDSVTNPQNASLSLPQIDFNRTRNTMPTESYYTYGTRPEFSFFDDNALPKEDEDEDNKTKTAAGGGRIGGLGAMRSSGPRGYVGIQTQSSGRADDIDARLSNGEYVFTAEDTALLGDGNPDHGARKLDKMRVNLRRDKGRALARGKISPDAKRPESYMRGGRR